VFCLYVPFFRPFSESFLATSFPWFFSFFSPFDFFSTFCSFDKTFEPASLPDAFFPLSPVWYCPGFSVGAFPCTLLQAGWGSYGNIVCFLGLPPSYFSSPPPPPVLIFPFCPRSAWDLLFFFFFVGRLGSWFPLPSVSEEPPSKNQHQPTKTHQGCMQNPGMVPDFSIFPFFFSPPPLFSFP